MGYFKWSIYRKWLHPKLNRFSGILHFCVESLYVVPRQRLCSFTSSVAVFWSVWNPAAILFTAVLQPTYCTDDCNPSVKERFLLFPSNCLCVTISQNEFAQDYYCHHENTRTMFQILIMSVYYTYVSLRSFWSKHIISFCNPVTHAL